MTGASSLTCRPLPPSAAFYSGNLLSFCYASPFSTGTERASETEQAFMISLFAFLKTIVLMFHTVLRRLELVSYCEITFRIRQNFIDSNRFFERWAFSPS